jgi:hypothetical protein
MNEVMQGAVVVLLVGGAVGYLALRVWRSWRAARLRKAGGGCGDGCGCD